MSSTVPTPREEPMKTSPSPMSSSLLKNSTKSGTPTRTAPPSIVESDSRLCDRPGSQTRNSSGSGPALVATKGKSKSLLPSWKTGSRIDNSRLSGTDSDVTSRDKSQRPSAAATPTRDEKTETPPALRLPLDVLRHLLLQLESVTDILACGAVCHVWRSGVQDEEMWRLLCAKLERLGVPPGRANLPDSTQDRIRIRTSEDSLPSTSPPPVSQLPTGSEARGGEGLWKIRFWRHLRQWKRMVCEKEAERHYHLLHPPFSAPLPPPKGPATALVANLHLTFFLQINGRDRIRFEVPRSTTVLHSTVCLRTPPSALPPSLSLASLSSLELSVESRRLMTHPTIGHTRGCDWRLSINEVWHESTGRGPLRFLHIHSHKAEGIDLIVGTVREEGNAQKEQLVLLTLIVHWTKIAKRLLPQFEDNIPSPRLPGGVGVRVGVQVELHSLQRSLWVQNRVAHMEGGEAGRVYQLLPSGSQVALDGNPRVRWRSTAFGGEVEHASLVTITAWGPARRDVWHECAPITFLPLSAWDEINAGFRPVELDRGVMVRGEVRSCVGVVSLTLLLPQQQETKTGCAMLVEGTLTQVFG